MRNRNIEGCPIYTIKVQSCISLIDWITGFHSDILTAMEEGNGRDFLQEFCLNVSIEYVPIKHTDLFFAELAGL